MFGPGGIGTPGLGQVVSRRAPGPGVVAVHGLMGNTMNRIVCRGGKAALLLVILSALGCPAPAGKQFPAPQDDNLAAMETQAFNAINDARVQNGFSPLVMRDDLQEMARAHSQDMV